MLAAVIPKFALVIPSFKSLIMPECGREICDASGGADVWQPGSRSDRMLVEMGHFALVLALLVAAVQGSVPLIGASVRSRPLMDLARPAALLQVGMVGL